MCKTSALPAGYCPVNVTNLMVRRERLIRRMRQRNEGTEPVSRIPVVGGIQRRMRTLSTPANYTYSLHGDLNRHPTSTSQGTELTNMGTRGSRASVPRPEAAHVPGESERQRAAAVATVDEPPAEVVAQGAAARRVWMREQVARRQEQQYAETAEEAREVDVRRPLCKSFSVQFRFITNNMTGRRIGGRFSTRLE
jgi:hypothetical protein